MNDGTLRLHLRIDPGIPLVSVARRFVENALEKFLSDPDLVARVAMATHELLENAARYSRNACAELTVVMNRDEADPNGRLTLRLSNTAGPKHIDRLKQSFAELDACDDPLMLYVGLMRRNAGNREISGLGLARIRAEGEMTLGLEVEGEAVTIVAETGLLPAGDLA
jgi:anti-sigma regulatory factor (Ser/Thr protein kinase)